MSSKVGPTLRSARNNNNNTPASAKASDAGAGSEVSDQQVSSSSPTALSAADAPPMSADMAYIASLFERLQHSVTELQHANSAQLHELQVIRQRVDTLEASRRVAESSAGAELQPVPAVTSAGTVSVKAEQSVTPVKAEQPVTPDVTHTDSVPVVRAVVVSQGFPPPADFTPPLPPKGTTPKARPPSPQYRQRTPPRNRSLRPPLSPKTLAAYVASLYTDPVEWNARLSDEANRLLAIGPLPSFDASSTMTQPLLCTFTGQVRRHLMSHMFVTVSVARRLSDAHHDRLSIFEAYHGWHKKRTRGILSSTWRILLT
jgi:hypothetical protein